MFSNIFLTIYYSFSSISLWTVNSRWRFRRNTRMNSKNILKLLEIFLDININVRISLTIYYFSFLIFLSKFDVGFSNTGIISKKVLKQWNCNGIVSAKACFSWISIKRQSRKSLNIKHNKLNVIKRNKFEVWNTSEIQNLEQSVNKSAVKIFSERKKGENKNMF